MKTRNKYLMIFTSIISIFTTFAMASSKQESKPAKKCFYGYTPEKTQKWKEFEVVAGSGSEGNVECASSTSDKQTKIDT